MLSYHVMSLNFSKFQFYGTHYVFTHYVFTHYEHINQTFTLYINITIPSNACITMEDMMCNECRGTRFQEDGSYIVCTGCGLVIDEGVFLPDPSCNEYSNDYWTKKYYQEQDNPCYKDDCMVIRKYCYMLNKPECKFLKELASISQRKLNLEDNIVESARMLFTDFRSDNLKRGENMRGLMASSVYYACKMANAPRPATLIANAFGVCTSKLHKCCNELLDKLNDKPYHNKMLKVSCTEDLLVRMVYEVDDITDKWNVIKTCRKLIDKLRNCDVLRTQKPSKINATIIFIACSCLKLNIPKHVIQRDLNVSALTMINHEKLIQGLLQKKV